MAQCLPHIENVLFSLNTISLCVQEQATTEDNPIIVVPYTNTEQLPTYKLMSKEL